MPVNTWNRRESENKKSERPTMNLNDFPKVFSNQVIKTIVTEEIRTGRKYIEGYFHVNYLDEKNHSCTYELYFEDSKEKIYKTESKTGTLSSEQLTFEARKELAEEKIITFEIPEPSQAERDVYGGNFSLQGAFKEIFDIFTPKK